MAGVEVALASTAGGKANAEVAQAPMWWVQNLHPPTPPGSMLRKTEEGFSEREVKSQSDTLPDTATALAEQRSIMRGRRYNRTKKAHGGEREASGQSVHLKTAETLAKEHGVNEKTIRRDGKRAEAIEKLAETQPEQAQAVRDGVKRFNEVRREIKLEEVKKAVALPTAKYRVIYADPPWKYGDQLTEDYGPVKFHYPAMTITELCALPVREMSEPDAVLFLWVTSPLLFECLPMIEAWGFKYKTSFVWDKVKHNMGHYNSVRHEFLLICTRGSCTPDAKKLHDSVQSIERTTHSTKPEQFREIIEELYPHGKRLELFARKETAGWDTYGNQC